MTNEIKDKIKKVYALVERGTEGEQKAARAALDRLMKKYNLSDEQVENIDLVLREFTYTTLMEKVLFIRICRFLVGMDIKGHAYVDRNLGKVICIKLKHIDYVTADCAYEYFRKHMKSQWKKICAPELARCRKAKTRNKRRQELQGAFCEQYMIKSGLVDPDELKPMDLDQMSQKELADQMKLQGLEGGKYHTQVSTAHLLESGATPVEERKGQLELF
jgi:hypothetical protein